MISLGIESTAHTFGIGIVTEKGRILSDARHTFLPPAGWGIKPPEAADHHQEWKEKLLKQALKEANLTLSQIDVIAFSQGAGLPPCLRVGKDFAHALATDKTLVPVCHQIAHLEIGMLLTKLKDPISLYVSGGNTQVLSCSEGRYRVFGETQDIGIGNALDKFARTQQLQFPGGPKIEKLSKGGHYVELPYVVKGMDLSFSGILTKALTLTKQGTPLKDVCFSLQETLFAMLTEVTERALAHTDKKEVLLTGGVAANKRLCEMLDIMCRERHATFAPCPLEYSGDNGTMIAWNGIQIATKGKPSHDSDIKPRLRTDQVPITW